MTVVSATPNFVISLGLICPVAKGIYHYYVVSVYIVIWSVDELENIKV
jgi:hypothetical protein